MILNLDKLTDLALIKINANKLPVYRDAPKIIIKETNIEYFQTLNGAL